MEILQRWHTDRYQGCNTKGSFGARRRADHVLSPELSSQDPYV